MDAVPAHATARALVGSLLMLLGSTAWGQVNNQCDELGETPDVVVGDLVGRVRHGTLNGITAFSVGTTSCNLGKCWLKWISNTNEHPVIGQNIFRLKNGRFEQIGQSWVKHGFTALQQTLCSTDCLPSGTGSRLGVNCSDPYSASLNGTHTRLGPKFEVNAYSGVFAWPATDYSNTGDAIYKRLQVKNVDLDPAQNAGAQYFVEGQYVTQDDAQGGNGANNASYRPITVSGSGSTFDITLTGVTVRGSPAISAWKGADPAVAQTVATIDNDGRLYVSAKATDLGGGVWHYEYAVHNLDSHRSGRSFIVPLPQGAVVANIGFHDVDYHSGEPFDGTDWPGTAGGDPPVVEWHTSAFAENPNANALRWGTLYNFRFDANVPPATDSVTVDLFRPGNVGDRNSIDAVTVGPRVCDNDGVCEPGETCQRCATDCGSPGPGGLCCGNGVCEPHEGSCTCPSDCGPPTSSELVCNNSADDDCDGQEDCADRDCCPDAACASSDGDGDQVPAACDCNDADPGIWETPGECVNLSVSMGVPGEAALTWSPPTVPGGSSPLYDVLRSGDPTDFVAAATCVAPVDLTEPTCSDPETPLPDGVFYYLVRARNACPAGNGSLGHGSGGSPRTGRACP